MRKQIAHKKCCSFPGCLAVGLIMFLTSLSPADSIQVSITVNETSVVKGESIVLGQIATINASDFIRESLEKLNLGKSPRPGRIKVFDKNQIASRIRRVSYLPESATLDIPDRIYVKQRSQAVSADDIKALVLKSLSDQFSGHRFELLEFDVRGLGTYPDGTLELRPEKKDMTGQNGRLSGFVDIMVDNIKVDRVSIRGRAAVYETVLHVSRSFSKGEKIPRDATYSEQRNRFDLSGRPVRSFDKVAGKVLSRNIKKGAVVVHGLLAEPFLVKKGDIVTLLAVNDSLRIVTSGICMENAYRNRPVEVENISSGRRIKGIVRDKGKVEVIY